MALANRDIQLRGLHLRKHERGTEHGNDVRDLLRYDFLYMMIRVEENAGAEHRR